ncbi:MAG: hypothetical protein WC787_01570 [Patescibacteria group bacterium]|jgi:hypothetical protein
MRNIVATILCFAPFILSCGEPKRETGVSRLVARNNSEKSASNLRILDKKYIGGVDNKETIYAYEFLVIHDDVREMTCWTALHPGENVTMSCFPDAQLAAMKKEATK